MNIEESSTVELKRFKSQLSLGNKILRVVWGIAWLLVFRPFPRVLFGWRRFLLRCFGASVGRGVRVYGSARIYYPPHLILEDQVVIGPSVECYCVAPVTIKANSMVSQNTHLCAASHDHRLPDLPLIASPIVIESNAWVCADSFIGPGVVIGEGAVVGARSCVTKDVAGWMIVAGNPAREIKKRVLKTSTDEC